MFAALESAEQADLARVESLAKETRVSEKRILDEIMGRMGRIESTTSDIRALIEAMPDAPAAATPASQLLTPTAAVCPTLPPTPPVTADDNDDSTQFPISLIAGGSAMLALLVGLLLGRRRSIAVTETTKPVTETSAGDSTGAHSVPLPTQKEATNAPPVDHSVWRPNAKANNGAAVPAMVTKGNAPQPDMSADRADAPQAGVITMTAEESVRGQRVAVLPTAITTSGESDAFDPTLELAEIMLSMGLASGAAQALEEHIREHPREALMHWLKLLEVYRKDGHRTDFEKAAHELRKNFNIQASDWLAIGGREPSLEDFSRVIAQIIALWNQAAECVAFMTDLLEDNRDGMRNGFPQPVAEEILMLIALQRAMHPELSAVTSAAVAAVTSTPATTAPTDKATLELS